MIPCSAISAPKTYSIVKSGSLNVVVPAKFSFKLTESAAALKPNCETLFTKIHAKDSLIRMCSPGESNPAAGCRLLEPSLIELILGDDSPLSTSPQDTIQELVIVSSAAELPTVDAIARAENVAKSSLLILDQINLDGSSAIKSAVVDPDTHELLATLQQFDYLADSVGKIIIREGKLQTSDRLTYCALAKEGASIQGLFDYKLEESISLEPKVQRWVNDLYDHLEGLKTPLDISLDAHALLIGYEIGTYLIDHPLENSQRLSVSSIFTEFYKKLGTSFSLNKLTDDDLSRIFANNAKLNIQSNFEAKLGQ
ncbi:MAG: hypothetical protein EOP04_20275 [Proteobacteria bacterium]|nr:MAG: hypothetical protein EOP04_20275 [Pseudomonadota bacterium]